MLAIHGICSVCKRELDIITAGMVCSSCEKFFHGTCMKPIKQYKELEKYVINTKEWLCENCAQISPGIQYEIRTGEEKEKVLQKAELLFELREAIIMVDDIVTIIMCKCDYLIKSAKMIRKQNCELRNRINLREIQSDLPVTLSSWVKKRKMLKIGDILPSVYADYSSEEISKLTKRFSRFKKDENFHNHHSFLQNLLTSRCKRKRKKKHRVLEKLDAPPLRRRILFIFSMLNEHHSRWQTQVILFVSLSLHTFLGAVVLYAVEGSHERNYHEKILLRRSSLSNELSTVENSFSIVGFNNSNRLLQNISCTLLSSYYDFIEAVILDHYKNGGMHAQPGNWDFLGSLFFCATTSMTIGFGDLVPVTDFGKVISIIFALTGVPLFLTFASSLGKSFNDLIHQSTNKAYVRRKSILLSYSCDMDEDLTGFPLWKFFALYFSYVLFGTIVFMFTESWNFLDSYYFVVLTLATIGIGDMIPTNRNLLLGSLMFLIGGYVMTATAIHMIMWKLRKRFKIINAKLEAKAEEYYE